MAEKKLIIFDMDGTINDSSPGIAYCFQKTGEHYGKYDLSSELLRTGLSGSFEKNIMRILDLRPDQVMEAVEIYVKYYTQKGQGMSEIFSGMKDTLTYLADKGYRMSVATMMVEDYASRTLAMNHLDHFFTTIKGTNFTTPITKLELIESCLMANDIGPEDAVMIGDGIDDYRSAHSAGVEFIGAIYGYEVTEEFCRHNGCRSVSSPKELMDIF